MKTIVLSLSLISLLLFNAFAQQPDYSQLRSEAEAQYAQGSYARAKEVYEKVDKTKLSPSDLRWVEFRLADTSWRAQAATQNADTTILEQAKKQLEELIRVIDKDEDRDLVWAEAFESLGDLFWTRTGEMNWGSAWPCYQRALDWWAGQRDLERARDRYLKIVFKAAHPPRAEEPYVYTYNGYTIPIDVLENALKISRSANEKAHISFLIAMSMRHTGGDLESRQRVPDQFEDALSTGKQTDWYDDALFYYADWMNSYGSVQDLGDGNWQQLPDYVKALELYRRVVSEFAKGETRYYDLAVQQIKNITEASVSVAVSNIFLPDSELQFGFAARNVKRVDFALYKVDITRDVGFLSDSEEAEGNMSRWVQRIQTAGKTPVKVWSRDLKDSEAHKAYNETNRIEGKLPVGAYLLEAKGGALTARDVVLVSDATLVVKSSANQALVFFANALTGAPIPNASVALWESTFGDVDRKWHWRILRQTTDADGLARFELSTTAWSRNLFATAAMNERQAFSAGTLSGKPNTAGWLIYAFTDRPAYRPGETMQWKFIARREKNRVYTTPANESVYYEITDSKGTKVSASQATLNSFGSAWGSLELSQDLPLGEYKVEFRDKENGSQIGRANLFRLEEYKLPEFKVQVKTPEQDGKKKAFRLGEKVEIEVQADYYFGGPVSNGSVEVIVYQNYFQHYWRPRREYAWYYSGIDPSYNYQGAQGTVIKRESVRTDATGKAKFAFDTPRENYNQDFEYYIEARVVDSSRREIVASDRVRVTRNRYYVYPRPAQNIYRPKDKVTIDIKALDANEQPVQTEGTVKVTRDYWWEIWIDPSGREVQGEELRRLRERAAQSPSPVDRGQRGWRLKFRGYQHQDILTQTVKTDSEGVAQFNFTADREGYYRVAWQSSQGVDARRDRFLPPIKAETYVFVASNATTDLGYRNSGLQIIVDNDTFRAGQTAPVMIATDANDRYVLFSVEADDLFSYKLVHVTGNAKLLEVPIEQQHVPNVFLSALMISNTGMTLDTKQVIVPPVEQFLAVAVKADREQYQPREDGTLTVTTKDAKGRPVSAEVALGLVDESIRYIQEDYAGDPRQFYYGSRRNHTVQTQSTLNQKSYARLVEIEEGQLRDQKLVGAKDDDRLGPIYTV
ncbi:MAG TPA: MG2 domain-containing protein, partial [Pyrinomonadaceae bacterium]|nr:MG2 domain-containing protein [Pyrinomonadaceae bacterium]